MLKRILKNKSFLLSVLTFCFSLLVFATVGYAWITISRQANVDAFNGVVAPETFDFQFSKIINNELVHSENIETEHVVPGDKNTFVLTVTNESADNSFVNVFFSEIFSDIYSNGAYVPEYSEADRYKKIQYAYSYKIDLMAYVPDNTVIQDKTGNNTITVPTEEEMKGWEQIPCDHSEVYFNRTDSSNNDIKNYSIIDKLEVHKKQAGINNSSTKSTVLVYFTITFNGTPSIPPFITNVPHDIDFNGEYYSNQRFIISNIIIQGAN